MAREIYLKHNGCEVIVATNDVVDRPPVKTSLRSACEKLGIESWSPDKFCAWVASHEAIAVLDPDEHFDDTDEADSDGDDA